VRLRHIHITETRPFRRAAGRNDLTRPDLARVRGLARAGLALALLLASATASNAEKLYWSNTSTDTIQRSNLDGSALETVVAGVTSFGIALDPAAGKLYWTDLGDPNTLGDESIRRSNLDGSGIEILLGAIDGVRDPVSIAVDPAAGWMYWTDAGAGARGVYRADLDGSNRVRLIDVEALGAARAAAGIPGLEFSQVWGLALDVPGGSLYWCDYFAGDIHRADLDGTNIDPPLVSGLVTPRALALDAAAGRVLWSQSPFESEIGSVGQDGSLPIVFLGRPAWNVREPFGMAVDPVAGQLYWTDSKTGEISRIALDGTAPEVVLTLRAFDPRKNRFRAESPFAIAIDTTPPPPPPPPVRCGLGFEVAFVVPVLVALRRRRLVRSRS